MEEVSLQLWLKVSDLHESTCLHLWSLDNQHFHRILTSMLTRLYCFYFFGFTYVCVCRISGMFLTNFIVVHQVDSCGSFAFTCFSKFVLMCFILSYDSNMDDSRDNKKNRFSNTMAFMEEYLNNVLNDELPFHNEEKNKLTYEVRMSPLTVSSCSFVHLSLLLFLLWSCPFFCSSRLWVWPDIWSTLVSTVSLSYSDLPERCWASSTVDQTLRMPDSYSTMMDQVLSILAAVNLNKHTVLKWTRNME